MCAQACRQRRFRVDQIAQQFPLDIVGRNDQRKTPRAQRCGSQCVQPMVEHRYGRLELVDQALQFIVPPTLVGEMEADEFARAILSRRKEPHKPLVRFL